MNNLDSIKSYINQVTSGLMSSLPDPANLSNRERTALIARYTAVLEGNFIAWMTAAHLAVSSESASSITKENLREEIEGNHPGMLRKFSRAANAEPGRDEYNIVYEGVESVRQFNGRQFGLGILVMMAFFENFIATFMPYLATLGKMSGSTEMEYTDVHGGLDVVHTEGLYRAIQSEMDSAIDTDKNLTEGIDKLESLLRTIIGE